MATYCKDEKLLPIDRTGMARLIEHAQELTGKQEKLTLQLKDVLDVVKEANYRAGDQRQGPQVINEDHRQGHRGKDLPVGPARGETAGVPIDDGMLFIETAGAVVGQIQRAVGLRPGGPRLRTPHPHHRLLLPGQGRGGLAIDREAKLAGNIHNKGVLILASFLKGRFARNKPLTLSANLTFEQSYGMVEGDSASHGRTPDPAVGFGGRALKAEHRHHRLPVSQRGEAQPIGPVISPCMGATRSSSSFRLSG